MIPLTEIGSLATVVEALLDAVNATPSDPGSVECPEITESVHGITPGTSLGWPRSSETAGRRSSQARRGGPRSALAASLDRAARDRESAFRRGPVHSSGVGEAQRHRDEPGESKDEREAARSPQERGHPPARPEQSPERHPSDPSQE